MWWLRSLGDSQSDAAYVYYDGDVSVNGKMVNYDDNAVRPAMWIEIH
jgi:hypothetical protein